MDNDKSNTQTDEGSSERKDSDPLLIFKQLFSTIWLRCLIQDNNGLEWFLLDHGYRILFYIGIVSYLILFLT